MEEHGENAIHTQRMIPFVPFQYGIVFVFLLLLTMAFVASYQKNLLSSKFLHNDFAQEKPITTGASLCFLTRSKLFIKIKAM